MERNEFLLNKIKNLPQTPGVYRFLNGEREILYVGKSKHLRARVSSYFSGEKEGKIQRLVCQIRDVEVELCETHLEARLLECRRIKELRPPFNAQFKRERGFLYLKLGERSGSAPFSVTADPRGHIGPFRNRRLLEEVLAGFPRLFPLSREQDERGRTVLGYRWSILPRRLSSEEFQENRLALQLLFEDPSVWNRFVNRLECDMKAAAEEQRFAEAIFFRDFRKALKILQRYWFEDRTLFETLVFLKIPAASGGVRFFRVRNGAIEDIVPADQTEDRFTDFCRDSSCRLDAPWKGLPERTRFDFTDILYSEIRALPPEQVVMTSRPRSGRRRAHLPADSLK